MDSKGFADLEHFGMNTVMTHRACGARAQEALRAVREEAERLEGLLSRFIPESDVGRLNRSAGAQSEKMSVETLEVLARAAEISQSCGGLFDVTIAPLVSLWSRGKAAGAPPDADSIRQTLSLAGYAGLTLDARERTAALKTRGQAVDLGGIGKGYAADRFLQVFKDFGVASAFTNIGGNVAALGCKPDGSPWRVGIRHPRAEGALLGAVSIENRSVVTSGDYQRFFTGPDGKRYHHILDPRTGFPAESGLVSATVVAESSMDADALSTMVFVAGLEKGLGLLKRFEGAEAVAVTQDLKVYVTAGLKGSFQLAAGIDVTYLD